MPSYLDFDTTKTFRNFILGKTLTVPNGPQSFTSGTYTMQKTSDMSNVDPGDVETIRPGELVKAQTSNTFKPIEYFVKEDFTTIPRKANLALYPYFETGQYHSFISIMAGQDYSNESDMMKFAEWNIKENPNGPLHARIAQNIYTTTYGKVRLLDALQGNTTTAINIVTGREPLIETNSKITVASTILGKGVDFLQTVAGVEFPWSEIPGDYLSNPRNPIINTEETRTGAGGFIRDASSALASLIGISRRSTTTKKPSDLFIEYMGRRQQNFLYDNLSYLKYGPDYTTTARSQNTSKIFTFADKVGQGVKSLLGWEAPKLFGYIGDDRSNNVTHAMSDFNDRQVRSSYYLSMLFDEVQAIAFLRTRNIGEGGGIGGKLTWISTNSQNLLGANNVEYASEQSKLAETLSTNFAFRDDSILGLTQEILNTLPTEGGSARGHVANVIDQTSRVFREDGQMMSRGSAIKYIDKFTGEESGVEYCRVWTKDRSYMNYSDTMKRTGTVRKFDSSILSKPWNLNIYPNSNGNGGFDSSSTNMAKGKGDGFYAKKYMFSIENLAWKTSNTPGFTYNDLPYCERGSNGGRVMWFPPYGLKVTEQNSAKWEENIFLGRPEPVYTYQNTSRNGTVTFKVIVDHPSILNLLVKDLFKNMSDEESDNYINAFFAGCTDVDFYGLIRKYATLTESDVKKIMRYLNGNGDTTTITKYKTLVRNQPHTPKPKNEIKNTGFNSQLFFKNDYPGNNPNRITDAVFSNLYTEYMSFQNQYLGLFNTGFDYMVSLGWTPDAKNDYKALSGSIPTSEPTPTEYADLKATCVARINEGFAMLNSNYIALQSDLETLKTSLSGKTVQNIKIKIGSRTSSVADDDYNLDLAYRRSYSVIKDIINRIANTPAAATTAISQVKWKDSISDGKKQSLEKPNPIKLTTLGYEGTGDLAFEYVENTGEQTPGQTGSGEENIDCSDNYKIITSSSLKQTAPVTFRCRESTVRVDYEVKAPDAVEETVPVQNLTVIEENIPPSSLPTPPIDEMKRIIMRTLSECYYFKKLEEDSPVQFTSLKEKLRYFHPSFHSMTPEGLNSRLTFLQQCIRPGETLPIKGISDASDLNARNTTFGPPPICVMRIGDFYNSKVAIRDVNIEFDEDLWDLNPEGIGVQPMIATVTLQLSFIGGHGLAKPVERLQNALSSNFYANTEMYDPRSISTESTIGGQKIEVFRQEFLDSLVEDFTNAQNLTSQATNASGIPQGQFIGEHDGSIEISYDSLIYNEPKGLYNVTNQYYTSFIGFYNKIVKSYGTSIASMFLSPTYRSIKDYTVQTSSGTQTIQLFGAYPKGHDFEVLKRIFKEQILAQIQNDNISNIFGFNKDLTPAVLRVSEDILNPYVYKRIGQIIDDMSVEIDIAGFEKKRNSVIMALDGLNFIIETDHDGSITGEEYIGATFDSGYTANALYSTYGNVINYITQAEPLFSEDLDITSYTFTPGSAVNTELLSKFLSELLNSPTEKANILKLYDKDTTIFTKRVKGNIEKRINKFMTAVPTDKDFSNVIPKNMPTRMNELPVIFNVEDFDYVFTDPEKVKLSNTLSMNSNKTTSTLNYYR